MRVLLLQDIPALGKKNDVKEVSGGYARNFLLPRKLAEPATERAMREAVLHKARKEKQAEEQRERFIESAEKMKNMTLSFKMKMGERGKAFGSVSAAKIANALKKQGVPVEKNWVALDEPIKTSGEHIISVTFPHGGEGKIKVVVEPE